MASIVSGKPEADAMQPSAPEPPSVLPPDSTTKGSAPKLGSKPNKVKLPLQLVSLIHGQEQELVDEGYLLSPDLLPTTVGGGASAANPPRQHHHTPTHVVMAAQSRFVKELSSYTRAVTMRLGFS